MHHPTVLNIGVNDANYVVGHGACPFYTAWLAMLTRCYSKREHTRTPGHAGCSVVTEWLTFSNFKKWMESQDWVGKDLDKDLRVYGNKVYGPKTCMFVSRRVNSLLNEQPRVGRTLPMGVSMANGKYRAVLKQDNKTRHIGMFTSAEDAHSAYKIAKADWILQQVAIESDPLVKQVLLEASSRLRREA